MEKNIENWIFYKIKKIIKERIDIKRNVKYLPKWKNYNSEFDK